MPHFYQGDGWNVVLFTPELRHQAQEASRRGIDRTLAGCIAPAKSRTPVVSGTLQGSIRFEPAKVEGWRVVGQWGSFDVNYSIFVETGANGRPGRNMLRGTADEQYPNLPHEIEAEFRRIA